MARIAFVARGDVAEEERSAYDAFVTMRGAEPSAGPFALLAHMPALAHHLETLRLLIRDEKSVPQRVQELVMITVAREMSCGYIWYAHAASARAAGVAGAVIDAIRERRTVAGLCKDEQAAYDYTCELLRHRKVEQATFERADASFGRRGTLTLTNLIACYAMLAYNMNAYELVAPLHATEPPLPLYE
jgi:4-carboxymuconolactone decarboxylase